MDENTENLENAPQGENAETPPSTETPQGAEKAETPSQIPKEVCTWAMLCHLLGLFTCFIGPLILWLLKKDEDPFIDNQGKEALNFQITVAIAFIIAAILTPFLVFVCIGFALIPAVGIADLVFCIIASVKAGNGEAYRYPVSIRFVK